ncbi:MAG: helix-turn-helix transcriptional regulator [Bacteroidales bacterium]|jgi:transcriptional regulator with XRE-family HTH domain|nr:helix-turn-helix transcriptional regulator [Bacteroidales bacterium]
MMDWYALSDVAIAAEMGKRLKTIRSSRRLTQGELAERAGVSVFTVSQIESGKNTSVATLLALLRVLKLLENVETLLPEQPTSPLSVYNQQRKKQRNR